MRRTNTPRMNMCIGGGMLNRMVMLKTMSKAMPISKSTPKTMFKTM
jgi:hypothetical protein